MSMSTPYYNWTLPNSNQEPCIADNNCACVLRIRYNISTADFEQRPTYPGTVDSSSNSQDPTSALITTNPYVQVQGQNLSLAVDTDQFGRTFQDRSHVFSIIQRPTQILGRSRVWNINVRGKRGNIVEVYPAVEYDFSPNRISVWQGDVVHFQWTGCDGNGNNEGEGTAGTDRSNMAQIASLGMNTPLLDSDTVTTRFFKWPAAEQQAAILDQVNCKSLDELLATDANNLETDAENCMKLNAASATQDLGLYTVNDTGAFYFMSTRNNHFSNRTQKLVLTVVPILSIFMIVVVSLGAALTIATVALGALRLHVNKNPLSPYASWVKWS